MGEPNTSSNLNPYKDPLFIVVNESAPTPLGNIMLDGNNYLKWSRSVRIALGAKDKLAFLDGKHPKPLQGPDEIQKWTRCDYMVRSWLLATMKPEIIEELEELPECACGAMSKCTCNVVKKVFKMQQNNKLMKFLMGLNSRYDQMKSNFLSVEPLIPVNKAYNLILQVERQKQIIGEMNNVGSKISALDANRQNQSLGAIENNQKKDYKKMRLEKQAKKCDHCGMRGHVKDECFKLLGYPEWFKNGKGKSTQRLASNILADVNAAMNDNPLESRESSGMKSDNTFIANVVQEVMKALEEKQKGGMSIQSNLAGKITVINAVNNEKNSSDNTWLIDSGASDHMTGNKNILHNLKTLDKRIRVGLLDGTIKVVSEIGSVRINPNVVLNDVFYVDDFKHNLLFVGKLVEKTDLRLLFDRYGCLLQDPSTDQNVKLMKKEPEYSHLRVIGSLCYASPHKKPGDKFAPRGLRCIMLGYPYNQKGYKLMELETRKIFVSRDVVFKEKIFPFLVTNEDNGVVRGLIKDLSEIEDEIDILEQEEIDNNLNADNDDGQELTAKLIEEVPMEHVVAAASAVGKVEVAAIVGGDASPDPYSSQPVYMDIFRSII
uniref:CCHC-type domain-containing protein n=1 Tax=Chenopodium quinoa TaxID=63459 RepID=A0A803L9R6_CHEQI